MAMKIYVSPSSQIANTYAAGNTNEAVQCRRIALATVEALKRCGFEAKTNTGGDMYSRTKESNEWGAHLHVPIHTNAFNGKLKGTRLFCFDTSGSGYKASAAILKQLQPVVPGESDGIKAAQYYEIRNSNAPCAYVEAAFHDNAEQAKWIIDHVDDIAEAICKGICEWAHVTYKAKSAGSRTIYRVQVGAFEQQANAERQRDELKAKGYKDAFIVKVEL